jgi:pentatricopeptide repeat protein
MVFKTLHIARQSLVKTLTYGYPQTVVAASQSYASQNNTFNSFGVNNASRFGKLGPTHQSAFQSTLRSGQPGNVDSGLAAYYAAWQRHQRTEENEWQQFQFAKRICWNTSSAQDAKAADKEATAPEQDAGDKRPSDPLHRSYSASAVDDPKIIVESAPLSIADTHAIEEIHDDSASSDAVVKSDNLAPVSSKETSFSHNTSATPSIGDVTPSTSVSEADSYADQLTRLVNLHSYAEIPAVFESMLLDGVKPTAPSYNALISAAVHLPRGKHHVVPKVLDIYADMLRRRVVPDANTFNILINLLARRSLDVVTMRQMLETKRSRFSATDDAGKFMFRSDETEFDILAEDNSLDIALKMFGMANNTVKAGRISDETYQMLISACAHEGRVDSMVEIYAAMEAQNVTPSSNVFPPMILAFASSGDLRSSVECYDEYKALAIANDNGKITMIRQDYEVYASLVRAYNICQRPSGAQRFLQKVEAMVHKAFKPCVTRLV